jgi:hypothetical protein
MGRNLDLDHCLNKQEAVIAAYAEELEENDKKIAEGAWATSLDLSRIKFWYRILMRYCPSPLGFAKAIWAPTSARLQGS